MSKKSTIYFGQGNTPMHSNTQLAKYLGLSKNLFFKREDYNPTGSYKDRSLPLWIETILNNKKNNPVQFVISSSGNAAISAAACCIITGTPLKIFISNNIESKKYLRLKKICAGKLKIGKWPFKSLAANLQSYPFDKIQNQLKIVKQKDIDRTFKSLNQVKIEQSKNPKKQAQLLANQTGAINLRGSTNDLATTGYEKIAQELISQANKKPIDLFLPVSSGTGAVGTFQGFQQLLEEKQINNIPRFHICQTEQVHTLIQNTKCKMQDESEKQQKKTIDYRLSTNDCLVPAICDHIGYRKKQIQEILKKTQGQGLILTNQEIRNASYLLNKYGIKTGMESALALAGLIKSQKNNYNLRQNIIILCTGK